MTAPAPIIWLFLHRSGKGRGVLIESVRVLCPPFTFERDGRIYWRTCEHLSGVPTATYIEDPRVWPEAAEEVEE